MNIRFSLLLMLFLLPGFSFPASATDDLLKEGDRIVFIGDSNTYAGHFVSDLDALLAAGGKKVEVLNVGLPSETCCGLSEPDHPFPRPTVQERIDRVLEKMKPQVVVACYGMNDGVYHPFSEERFKSYQAGIRSLIQKVKKSGARLVLLTPPPFDPLPMKKKNKLVGKDSSKFAWFLIYEDYDSVLKKYAEWILSQGPAVDMVVDIRRPIIDFQNEKRMKDADFVMSGDGVHFNSTCHRIIATSLFSKLLPGQKPVLNPEVARSCHARMLILRDAWLSETGHKRPGVRKGLPLDEATRKVMEHQERIRELTAK